MQRRPVIDRGWRPRFGRERIRTLGASLALAIAAALAQWPASAQPAPGHASTTAPPAAARTCFTDVFSGPLPGKSDYCLGMRDWSRGRYQSALELLKLAAGWGNKNAQYTLGLIYYVGHHVPADTALGLAWLKLADERRTDEMIDRAVRSALHWATPDERTRAGRLYQNMAETYGDKVAANRAWQRLHDWQQRHGSDSGCIRLTGAQAVAAQRLGLAGVPPQSIENMLTPPEPISIPSGRSAQGPKYMQLVMQAAKEQERYGMANSGVCVTLHTQQQAAQRVAEKYFDGWMGTVSVGPLQEVPAGAASTIH